MTPNTIIMIVPRLPPSIDGLVDYGLQLAGELRSQFGITTRFVVGDPNWKGEEVINDFVVRKVASRSVDSLMRILREEKKYSNTIFLNYVGYGYAKRGSPLWLSRGLQQLKNEEPQTKFVTMFHEIYASMGPIWNSQFWTSWLQQKIAKNLIDLSTTCFTSNDKYARTIRRFSKDKERTVTVVPVFSNVGETSHPKKLIDRANRLTIFGGKGWRKLVYQNSLPALENICRELGITEILDVGAPIDISIPAINNISVKSVGIKSSQEISAILDESRVGAFFYPTDSLCKSGIFAAYCAHKVLPVGYWNKVQKFNGVEPNKHYWQLDGKNVIDLEEAQKIADQANLWYQDHRLAKHAQSFKPYLDI